MDRSSLLTHLRAALGRLACSPAEIAALGVLTAGSLAVMATLWVRTPGPEPSAPTPTGAAGDVEEAEDVGATITPAAGRVVVHVAGAVAEPGLHELPGGARVADAVDAAGGPAPDAVLDHLNLAREVTDGEHLLVPDEAAVASQDHGGSGHLPDGRVDLNRADVGELQELPGVGPVTAERIVRHRETHGHFDHPEDLLAVPGIGERTLEHLADLVGT